MLQFNLVQITDKSIKYYNHEIQYQIKIIYLINKIFKKLNLKKITILKKTLHLKEFWNGMKK